ncbi:MAG: ATP-dependent DNA helicase [Silvanigrellales bacterium]|nr:ATP-dependent DNA helicase [Silvanigrellales bacterium]
MNDTSHPVSHEPPSRRQLSLAVRDFVAPLERSGSLNQTRSFGLSGSLRQVGAQIHAQIQGEKKESIEGYRSEVSLQTLLPCETGDVLVSGRLDGLYENAHALVVEEIKSTTNLHGLAQEIARNPLHPSALQARMYAWMLEASGSAAGRSVSVRLLLVSVHDVEDTRSIDLDSLAFGSLEFGSFDAWVAKRAHNLLEAAKVDEAWQAARQAQGEALVFPFPFPRAGQLELVQEVADAISSGSRLLVQAPTGLGKTAGVLFPHLRDALQNGRQVFYLTPKNSQHAVAQDAVERLRAQGSDLRSVVISSKEKSCLKDEVICDPKHCEYALGYYDKLASSGVLDELSEAGVVDAALLRDKGMEHSVCPFELSLDFTARADVVICDYNYAFSPNATLQRYFDDDARSHLVNMVIDEAHNLYARAMDLYSPKIAQSTLETYREKGAVQIGLLDESEKLKKRYLRLLDRALETLSNSSRRKITDTFVREGGAFRGSSVVAPDADAFFKIEAALGRFLTSYSEKTELLRPTDPVFELYRLWSEFCGVLRLGGNEFVFTWQETAEDAALQCTCCDASRFLQQRMAALGAVTAFSATLKPFAFYAQMSGFEAGTFVTREFASPFPRENRKVVLIPQVSTTFKERERNYPKIAEIIERVVPLRKGNTFVFFPSFAFLGEIARRLDGRLKGFRVYAQQPGMTSAEQSNLLAKFRQKTKNVVVLAVQGGVFSEGIDLPGDELESALIVGPSLPTFDLERECIRAYFDRRYGRGFDYAYVYPAMARVVQAAGRVIRTPTDKGLVLLCDKRFLQRNYLEVMPAEWLEEGVEALMTRALLKDVSDFWQEAGKLSDNLESLESCAP